MTFIQIVDVLFSLGLFINAALFVPQAWKIYKTKNATGVSLLTFGGFNLIQISAVLYGYLHHDYLLMTGFLLSLITCGCVTLLGLFYKNSQTTNLIK